VGGGFDSAVDEVEAVGFAEVAEVSKAAREFDGSAGSDSEPLAVSTDSSE
jgi:hypothetical protein